MKTKTNGVPMRLLKMIPAVVLISIGLQAQAKTIEPANTYGPIQVMHNFFPNDVACDSYPGESGKTVHFVKASGLAGEGGGELTVSASDESVSTTKEVASICRTLNAAKAKRKSVELVGQRVTVVEPEGNSEIFWVIAVTLNSKPTE